MSEGAEVPRSLSSTKKRSRVLAEDSCDVDAATSSATRTQQKRKTQKTIKGYNQRNRLFAQWCEKHKPEVLDDDGEIIIPLPDEVQTVNSFFSTLTAAADRRDSLESRADLSVATQNLPFSFSYLDGFRSSIMSLYTNKRLIPSHDMIRELKETLEGYEITLGRLRRKGLAPQSIGKRELTLEGYTLIAKKLMTIRPKPGGHGSFAASAYGWAWWVLSWNEIARPEAIKDLNKIGITWCADYLKVDENGGKGDAAGQKTYSKNLFANPNMPAICPILSLAVLMLSPQSRDPEEIRIFPQSSSYDRFADILQRVKDALSLEDIAILGCDPKDIGPYSCRKGAATLCTGQPTGPNPVLVQLRMGHTLGRVNDPYMHRTEGGDSYVGRTASGLPINSINFAVLPPHFDKEGRSLLTQEVLEVLVPGYRSMSVEFKPTIPFLIASLLYHESFLRSELDPRHPIFYSPVFAQNEHLDLLRQRILTGQFVCTDTGLHASGLPSHTIILGQFNELKEEVKLLREALHTFQDVSNSRLDSC